MIKRSLFYALTAISVALCFTPFYSYGFLGVLAILVVRYPIIVFDFFRPLSTRLVATTLLFFAWIMTLSAYAWLIHLTIPAVVYVATYTLGYLWLYRKYPKTIGHRETDTRSIRAGSLISTLLAISGVSLVIVSFYFPQPSVASTVQIITNGYDNSAHLSLIRTTYNEGGYVYGNYESLKDKIAWKTLTAYPQGWHLSNAVLWKGSGFQPFSSPNIHAELNMYVATLLSWYFIAVFLFGQLIFYIVRKAGIKLDLAQGVLITALSFLMQLLVFWGSLSYGFGTFLCALAYLFILCATIVAYNDNRPVRGLLLLISLLCITAIAQGWLFATPIVIVMLGLALIPTTPTYTLRKSFFNKHSIRTLLLSTLAILPIVVQFYINLQYSTQGSSQINDDGGIFGISTLLATVLVLVSLGVILSPSLLSLTMRKALIVLVGPALGFTGLLLLYQLSTLGHPSYFFTKSLSLTLCLVSLPLALGMAVGLNRTRTGIPSLHLIGIISALFLFVPFALGQDLSSFKRLLQRNSNITRETSQVLANEASDGSIKNHKVLVLTQEKYDGDVIGSIFALTASANRSECANDALWIIITRRNNEFPHYANLCTQRETLEIITTRTTDKTLLGQLTDDIQINYTR